MQQDVEMPIPKYFINERMTALKEREKMLGQILAKLGPQDEEGVGKIRYFIILSVGSSTFSTQ